MWVQPGLLGPRGEKLLGWQLLAPECSPVWPSLHFPPTGMEQQTAEEKACGDFVINGSDTPYGMMNFTYEPEEFERLVALSRYNVLNNAETLRHALRLALEQRQAGDWAGA